MIGGRRGLKGKGLQLKVAVGREEWLAGCIIITGSVNGMPTAHKRVNQTNNKANQASCQISLQAHIKCAHRRPLQDSKTESRACTLLSISIGDRLGSESFTIAVKADLS